MKKMDIIKIKDEIVDYFYRTILNKVVAIVLFLIGIASAKLSGDATFLVFATFISSVLFFSNDNCIEI